MKQLCRCDFCKIAFRLPQSGDRQPVTCPVYAQISLYMASLRALTPCPGFEDLQQPACSGQAVEMSQLWMCPRLLCRPPKEHVHAELRARWPHSTCAEMGLCACTQNLLGSTGSGLNGTCAAGLTFLTNRLSVFHVRSCTEVSQMHPFPCVPIIWAEILDRNMGILLLIRAPLGEEEMSMTLH